MSFEFRTKLKDAEILDINRDHLLVRSGELVEFKIAISKKTLSLLMSIFSNQLSLSSEELPKLYPYLKYNIFDLEIITDNSIIACVALDFYQTPTTKNSDIFSLDEMIIYKEAEYWVVKKPFANGSLIFNAKDYFLRLIDSDGKLLTAFTPLFGLLNFNDKNEGSGLSKQELAFLEESRDHTPFSIEPIKNRTYQCLSPKVSTQIKESLSLQSQLQKSPFNIVQSKRDLLDSALASRRSIVSGTNIAAPCVDSLASLIHTLESYYTPNSSETLLYEKEAYPISSGISSFTFFIALGKNEKYGPGLFWVNTEDMLLEKIEIDAEVLSRYLTVMGSRYSLNGPAPAVCLVNSIIQRKFISYKLGVLRNVQIEFGALFQTLQLLAEGYDLKLGIVGRGCGDLLAPSRFGITIGEFLVGANKQV